MPRRAVTVRMLVHDLRRTAARDFRRAGVSEGEIMKLCGWRTRSIFDRYNIIDEADLAAAVAKRFGNAKQTANITTCAPALNFQPQQFLDPCLSWSSTGLRSRCAFRARPRFCNF